MFLSVLVLVLVLVRSLVLVAIVLVLVALLVHDFNFVRFLFLVTFLANVPCPCSPFFLLRSSSYLHAYLSWTSSGIL